jgi:hypothetical protein
VQVRCRCGACGANHSIELNAPASSTVVADFLLSVLSACLRFAIHARVASIDPFWIRYGTLLIFTASSWRSLLICSASVIACYLVTVLPKDALPRILVALPWPLS